MIELDHVYKVYETPSGEFSALIDIHLSIQPGEIFGVMGKSGAGKSSLIRCVNLLERPTRGSVRVNGRELTALSPAQLRQARREMGMIFQHFNLLANRTVLENAGLPLELAGHDRKTIRAEILPLLALVGLEKKHDAYPSHLSGGQKQRVAIARALATHPKILLCDEMTSSLDPETTRSILELLQEINQRLNLSILFITHEMAVVKAIADRVAVLDHGRIVEEADVFTLFTHPKSAITKSFIRLTLPLELPVALMNQVRPGPFPGSCAIWRLIFSGGLATQPVINELLKSSPIHLNILQANLEIIRHKPLGFLIVTIQGEAQDAVQAKRFLEDRGLTVEVIGYVGSDVGIVS